MKRLFTQLTMVVTMLTMGMTLTSCDEDIEQAYDLNGVWKGWITTTIRSDRFGYYEENWETVIEFVQDGDFSRGGYGYEYDCSPNGRVYKNEFDWTVRNGRIYMYYDDGSDIVIDRYSQTSDRFSGIFCDARTYEEVASFRLIKTYDSHDEWWAPERANTRSAAGDSIQAVQPANSIPERRK